MLILPLPPSAGHYGLRMKLKSLPAHWPPCFLPQLFQLIIANIVRKIILKH